MSTLQDVIDEVQAGGLDVVDAREWEGNWGNRWVAFIDLIGIAERSRVSPAATVNLMVRFHRAITSTGLDHPTVRLLRFTDAAYAVADSAEELVKFASDFHHRCLALNALQLARGKSRFHTLVIARTTIAFGSVLEAHGAVADDERFAGVDAASLLIGEGVVNAYKLERSTAGELASVSKVDAPEIKALEIRGLVRPPRRLLERWATDEEVFAHDDVVDIPWMLLRARQPEAAGLWATSYDDVLTKMRIETAMWKLSFTEYTSRRLPIGTIKHYGAVNRHLNELFQGLKRHATLKAWGLAELEAAIESERSKRPDL